MPFNYTALEYNSTHVKHALFNKIYDAYEAPFASVLNNEGAWIPLQYSLLLMNSGMMLVNDTLLIDMPTKSIVDHFYDITGKTEEYGFDWADDFGYTNADFKVLGAASHLVNVFNGVLAFDGDSWVSLFQQFLCNTDAYDAKYGEKLATLLCTESDEELEESGEKIDLFVDLLSKDGALGEILSGKSEMLDAQVGNLTKICEETLQGVRNGNAALVTYDRSYQALEATLDKQTMFYMTGGNVLEAQKGLSTEAGNTFTLLKLVKMATEVSGYSEEFQNHDRFTCAALSHYLGSSSAATGLPGNMRDSMSEHCKALSGELGDYMAKRFKDNIVQWIMDAADLAMDAAQVEFPLHRIIGMQAAGTLLAWSIASNTIPFIKNGLSGADSYELALYSQLLQCDSFIAYQGKRNSVFSRESVSAEELYDLSQYCYTYLKSCYVTREAAIKSLASKPESIQEKIQPLIEQQNQINAKIARILVVLKGANDTNKGNVYGFLPSDNQECLKKHDDSGLVQWLSTLKKNDMDTDASSEGQDTISTTFSSASEAYAAVIDEWRDRISYDKAETASGAMRNAGNWYYSVSPSYVSLGSNEDGGAFVYCYRSYDAFDDPMLVVAGSNDDRRVYGMYQYVAKEKSVAVYTAHFRHHKYLCEDQCLRSWRNTAGGGKYSTSYWSERPSGYQTHSDEYGKRYSLEFSQLESFQYNTGSGSENLGEFTDLSGDVTMMSVDEGRGTIDSAHPSAKGITWYRILDGFVSPGAPAEKARGDGQVFSATLDSLKSQARDGDFFGGLFYQLVDIDGDGVDELFVSYSSGSWNETTSKIFRIQDNDAACIFDHVQRGCFFQCCYPQTKTVVFWMDYKAMINTWHFQYENGALVRKAAMFDGRSYNGSLNFESAEGVKVTEDEYRAILSGLEIGEACQLTLSTAW